MYKGRKTAFAMWVVLGYPNASPEDVEINVTNKIEDELKGDL